MHILIDKTQMKMLAAASTRKWANLIAYVEYPQLQGNDFCVVDSSDGRTWTVLGDKEMAILYANMSSQDAPAYGEAIEQLRAYADTWPTYPKSESALEAEAEAIYAQEQAEADPVEQQRAANESMRQAHQATIAGVEAANAKLTPEQKSSQATAPQQPKPKNGQNVTEADRPRQGITKRIWEIADQLLSVTGSVGNIKEFRKEVVARAVAEGANEGTANTQFGKWKSAKGF